MITVNFDPEMDGEKLEAILGEIRMDQMGGWMELPRRVDMAELSRVKEAAAKIREESDYLVCIGIGGSYLGHRAIIEALSPKSETKVVYAGNSLSARELARVLDEVGDNDFSINVISKSGETLEPKWAYEIFKKKLIEKYGQEEAAKRIYATTDADSGMLHDEAAWQGYMQFTIPRNIGGRYSVLTSVGLLPMAVAGVDIDELLAGAAEAVTADKESAMKYAWMRYALGTRGYDTEVFATFEPATGYFNEWLKQLFGESEGKNGQGVFPASVIYTTDLHSMGQLMQEGRRNLWETVVDYPTDELNAKAVAAVRQAHVEGGIPVLNIGVPTYDEKGFGELIYFFELACAVSAKLFGVNPFDQPGVQKYKEKLSKLISLQ